MFSYYSYSDKVLDLLSIISKNTSLYARKHKAYLFNSLVEFSLKLFLTEPLEFINKHAPPEQDSSSPVIEEHESVPQNLCSYERYDLQSITLRLRDNSLVPGQNGIILSFKNGALTSRNIPPLQDGEHFQTFRLDQSKRIGQVSFRLSVYGTITGLIIQDIEQTLLLNQTWQEQGEDEAVWVTRNVPDDQEIIGLRWRTYNFGSVEKVSLVLWKRRIY